MTVRGLIDRLSKLPPDLPVAVLFAECDGDEFALLPSDVFVKPADEVEDEWGLSVDDAAQVVLISALGE